ncbi:hypothetical protein BU26DRAFT_385528, partial [Trematosphaeria pertusa]
HYHYPAVLREKKDFLRWLDGIDFNEDHEATLGKRHPGTGQWFINRDEFQQWYRSGRSTLLWCWGMPGAGKSVLASISLDYIRTTEDSRGGVGIAYAYLKYDSREHQNPARVLASFLKQLCQKLDEVPEDIFNIFLKFERNDKAPTVREYYQMLYDIAVNYFQEVILVLDALDECDQDRREELI